MISIGLLKSFLILLDLEVNLRKVSSLAMAPTFGETEELTEGNGAKVIHFKMAESILETSVCTRDA